MEPERYAIWPGRAASESALKESEERFRSAFDYAPTGFMICELDHRIRAVNKSLCDMVGFTEPELLRMSTLELVHDSERAGAARLFEDFSSGEIENARVVQRLVGSDGRDVWVSVTSTLIRGGAVRPDYLVAQIMDLTPRWQAEQALAQSTAALRESEERFRCAFESAANGFALVELDGRIRAVNRALARMFGYTPDEMLEKSFRELSHPDDLKPTLALVEDVVAGNADHFTVEKRYINRDGHVIWVELTIAIVRVTTGPPYFIEQLTDITKRRDVEAALKEHSEELERSNADLESFAYIASHDLQQPLRTVASYGRLLVERYTGSLDQRADRWLGHIQNGIDHMQNLVNDLLKLSRLRTDGNHFAAIDVGAMTRRIWAALDRQEQVPAVLSIGDLPVVHGDVAQIELLMQNLLDNAFKYRRDGVTLMVTVDASPLAPFDGRAFSEFSVKDNGIGFEMKNSELIFDMFKRLHSGDRYEGTGIGLTICRRIVGRHGGRIHAESTVGSGSTFSFTLPLEV
jgi:PAS domain S-box-containing protein